MLPASPCWRKKSFWRQIAGSSLLLGFSWCAEVHRCSRLADNQNRSGMFQASRPKITSSLMSLRYPSRTPATWRIWLVALFSVVLLVRGASASAVPHPSSLQHCVLHSQSSGAKRQYLDQTNTFQFDSVLQTLLVFPPLATLSNVSLPETAPIPQSPKGVHYTRPPPVR